MIALIQLKCCLSHADIFENLSQSVKRTRYQTQPDTLQVIQFNYYAEVKQFTCEFDSQY